MNDIVKSLQIKCGIQNPDGIFGKATFNAARNYLNLTKIRAAHFFGQCEVESGNFTKFEEGLNYSGDRLYEVFPSHFSGPSEAEHYAHNPEKIANRIYANRMGNGDEASGDGWRYRGRGAIQLTGKDNYTGFAHHANNPEILKNPDIVITDLAFDAAYYFFDKNNIWKLCDQSCNRDTITKITKVINRGNLGLSDRIAATQKYMAW